MIWYMIDNIPYSIFDILSLPKHTYHSVGSTNSPAQTHHLPILISHTHPHPPPPNLITHHSQQHSSKLIASICPSGITLHRAGCLFIGVGMESPPTIQGVIIDLKSILPRCPPPKIMYPSLHDQLVISLSSFFLSQVPLPQYRSQLPDRLISIIDQVYRIDHCRALRHDLLHQPLSQLIRLPEEDPIPQILWLFIDPDREQHLLSRHPHPLLTPPNSLPPPPPDPQHPQCHNFLQTHLHPSQVAHYSLTPIKSIDQIRLKCQANLYTHPQQFINQLSTIVTWQMLFRAYTLQHFTYLTNIHTQITQLLLKKDISRRFMAIKQEDINRLLNYEVQFRTQCNNWPIVPSSFRQYQVIDHYQPTPPNRTPVIYQRIVSKKEPVQCPPDCVCIRPLQQHQYFCHYSLLNGWNSECPNRLRKIQCQHSDPVMAAQCRNREISRHQRKKCLGYKEEGPAEIEEKLTWGIDLFTRNVIYHCLPEFDIQEEVKKINNEERRNFFIERTLTRAFNLLGESGYSLPTACQYIIENSPAVEPLNPSTNGSSVQNQKDVKNSEEKEQKPLFGQQDRSYAEFLMKNYELAKDKSSFRVHTKGKGAICIDPKGITQGSFIIEYFGQLYEPWRWYDRQDFIKEILKKKKLKNFIPEFYNIFLEKHEDQPLGYDILVVDPSRKGNFSSRFSHSCDPNCGTVTTVSQGRYFIGMYAFKDIAYGEELTFDYCSMTESNYEHINSICLCGMSKCRGNYLQLANKKIFNNLMDNKNCFYSRNSAILRSAEPLTNQDLQICAQHNLKEGFLGGSQPWLARWAARVLSVLSQEGQIYKNGLKEQWQKHYPWEKEATPEIEAEKIELYSETSKQELISIRTQNLITSIDKIKFFLSRTEGTKEPPIFLEGTEKILQVLIHRQDSVLLELQDTLIKQKSEKLTAMIQKFFTWIARQGSQHPQNKLFLFRLCCLVISHELLFLIKPNFNYQLLSDIVYFYAFTHTYFSPTQYKPFEAQQIVVSMGQITGERTHANERREKTKKKYASPFVWGQLVSWFKQTIVSPEASLSQDRRGTLSYPLIESIISSDYPYEKQNRKEFHKQLLQKPANSWPPADGCYLSFKNPHKLYGTMLFENVHQRERLAQKLPKDSLLESCLDIANSSLKSKLELFKRVEELIQDRSRENGLYLILEELGLDWEAEVPPLQSCLRQAGKEGRKRVKRERS